MANVATVEVEAGAESEVGKFLQKMTSGNVRRTLFDFRESNLAINDWRLPVVTGLAGESDTIHALDAPAQHVRVAFSLSNALSTERVRNLLSTTLPQPAGEKDEPSPVLSVRVFGMNHLLQAQAGVLNA